uniref:Uncharacterized protein n=1 Tax=Avena sativa TaxID=4498 RepID=A0ACD5ULE6_AVESA
MYIQFVSQAHICIQFGIRAPTGTRARLFDYMEIIKLYGCFRLYLYYILYYAMLGKLSNQAVSLRNDLQALQERTRIVEAQLGKITESQTLILAKFAGKAEPNPVEELKMMRIQREEPEELDYSNAPSPSYTVENLVKTINVKIPVSEGSEEAMYQRFVNHVAIKVRELDEEYKQITKKLPVKLDDIFESTIKIKIETNEIAALYDLGASVSTIPKSLLKKLNLDSFEITELKLHLTDSTYKQAVGINENTLVYIKGCPALIDFVIVDMPKDATACIIFGHPFLRTIKALIICMKGT